MRISRYQQGQLASSLVGTPGVDNSGLNTANALGESANALANTAIGAERNYRAQRAAATQNAFATVGNELEARQAYQNAMHVKQQELFIQGQVAGHKAVIKEELNNLSNGVQNEYMNNPGAAQSVWHDVGNRYVNDYIKSTFQTPTSKKDPVAQAVGARLQKELAGEIPAEGVSISNWARTRQTAITKDMVENIGPAYTNRVSNLNGTLDEKMQKFDGLIQDYSQNALPEIQKVSGTGEAVKQLRSTVSGMSKQLFYRLTDPTQIPNGPGGLQYLDSVSKELNGPRFDNLDAGERNSLNKTIVAARNSKETELIQQAADYGLSSQFRIEQLKGNALLTPNDRNVWDALHRQLSIDQKSAIEQEKALKNEPNEKIRIAGQKAVLQELKSIDQGLSFAERKGEGLDAEALAASRRAEATARRVGKESAATATKQEKALLKEQKRSSSFSLNTQFYELKPLLDDVSKNGAAIHDKVNSLLNQTVQLHNDGLLTDKDYLSKINQLNTLSGTAAKGNKKSFLWIPQETDKQAATRGKKEFNVELGKLTAEEHANQAFHAVAVNDNHKADFNNFYREEIQNAEDTFARLKTEITPAKRAQIEALATKRAHERTAHVGR